MNGTWDFQLLAVILTVAVCGAVLLRRAVRALRGEASGCSHCPQSDLSSAAPVQVRPLAQITLHPKIAHQKSHTPAPPN